MKEINLPDFEEMYGTISEIRSKTLEARLLKVEIESDEADITALVTSDSAYFINGKPPSSAHVSKAYLVTGISGELLTKRKRLAELEVDVEYLKFRYELDKIVIEVWRTQSANKRMAVE